MRYRVEIYDDVKANDLTIPMPNRINAEKLKVLIQQNKDKFVGDIRAYQYDTKTNKKVCVASLPMRFYKK